MLPDASAAARGARAGEAVTVGETGGGGKRFLWSVSDDGGESWSLPGPHPDLVTPVCMDNANTPAQYRGRVVTVGVHNAYHGDVLLHSDDH